MSVNPSNLCLKLRHDHPAFSGLGCCGFCSAWRRAIDNKTAHLVQLAASASIRSEGAVHSHLRRPLDAGATPMEIRQALMLTAPTIGFPNVIAAL